MQWKILIVEKITGSAAYCPQLFVFTLCTEYRGFIPRYLWELPTHQFCQWCHLLSGSSIVCRNSCTTELFSVPCQLLLLSFIHPHCKQPKWKEVCSCMKLILSKLLLLKCSLGETFWKIPAFHNLKTVPTHVDFSDALQTGTVRTSDYISSNLPYAQYIRIKVHIRH